MKLDSTLDDIQTSRFHNIYHNFIKKMMRTYPFTEQELTCILTVYYKYVLANGKRAKYMNRGQIFSFFALIFDIYEVATMERIVKVIAHSDSWRSDVTPLAWVRMFSIYMKSTLEEKIRFCFDVYDSEETGYLSRDYISRKAQSCIIGEEEEVENIGADLTDLLMRRLDEDRDGMISFNDYANTVRKTPALLQFLGKCIPDREGIVHAAHVCNITSVLREFGF